VRTLFAAPLCLALFFPNLSQAQDKPQPSRQELLAHDGIIWATAAAWIAPFPFQENLSEDAKIAGLSRLWMEVKINFPNFAAVPELDWDKTFIDFIPQVRATASGPGLIGRGVQPEVRVPRTVKHLLAGRDAALEAAVAELTAATR
jgi:hypothetical protein